MDTSHPTPIHNGADLNSPFGNGKSADDSPDKQPLVRMATAARHVTPEQSNMPINYPMAPSDLVLKIYSVIAEANKDPATYGQLEDNNLNEFCRMTTGEDSAETAFNLNDENFVEEANPEKQAKLKYLNRITEVVTSLDGKMAAAMTLWGIPVVFNLKKSTLTDELGHRILPAIMSNLPKHGDRQFVSQDDLTEPETSNRMDERKKSVKTIKMSFSQDSSFLVVSTCFESVAYDMSRVFLNTLPLVNRVQLLPVNIKGNNVRGDLGFQYFYKATFSNDLYIPADRQVLVLGFEKTVKFVVFCLDNYFRSEASFVPPHFTIDLANRLYFNIFKTEIHTRDPLHAYFPNGSNYLLLNRRTLTNKNSIECYKFDFDSSNKKNQISRKYEVELPANTTIFLKTANPSASYIFGYNSKRSEIQKVKFSDKSDKVETELVFKLTGKRKNLKYLAVKDDGKYLLLVDTSYNAEVMYRVNNGYVLIKAFNAQASNEQTNSKERKSKGVTEHDVSNMEFLEDGSGIVNYFKARLWVQPLNLAVDPPNHCIFNNRSFYYFNHLRRLNSTYTVWQVLNKVRYQKIIDFNPATNKGCIVRTFIETNSESSDQLFKNLDNLYKNVFYSDKGPKRDNHKELKEQLDEFMMGIYIEDEGLKTDPEIRMLNFEKQRPEDSDLEVYILSNSKEIVAFKKEDIQNYYSQLCSSSSDAEYPKPVWKHDIFILETYTKCEHVEYLLMNVNKKEGMIASMVKYKGAKIYGAGDVVEIPEGDFFFPIDKNTTLVCTHYDENASENEESEKYAIDEKKPIDESEKVATLRLFDLNTKSFTSNPPIKCMSKLPYFHMADTSNRNIKALIGNNEFGIYNVGKHEMVYKNIMFDKDGDVTTVNIEFDFHNFLQSPDKKTFVFSSVEDNSKICMYHVGEKTRSKKYPVITHKPRRDYYNRWCFSHDSKYLLLLVTDVISVYSIADAETVSKIPLGKIGSLGKVLSIQLLNESSVLELAIGQKNHVFYKRIPFYPSSKDLMLSDLNQKMDELSKTHDILERQAIQTHITGIMTSLPTYQKFLDSTYFKLLCIFDSETLAASYFGELKDDQKMIWKSPYPRLVSVGDMVFSHSASAFIDLLQNTLDEQGELPPINYRLLLEWLESGKLQIAYKRKLMNMITFKPCKFDLSGKLKNSMISMAIVPQDSKGVISEDWLDDVERQIFVQDSPNKQEYDCYRTAIKMDLNNGNRFAVQYFKWMVDMTDEDLKTRYKSVIYFKWSMILKYAVAYSCIFWILNALVCGFMAYAWQNWGVAIPIIILNVLFILFEAKCFLSKPGDSLRDIWNYYDILTHIYCFACTLAVVIGAGKEPNYQYNWLRVTCFSIVSFRGMTMLRVFQSTRYLLTMLFQAFGNMLAFLVVFIYIIFIYWFVCLVRPSLVSGGEDEKFYASLQQAFNIAFSNFDAELDSVIVFVTTIIGQIVLALVMLNYLIAIISKVYEDVSADRDLYDVKMLLDLIVEFEGFLERERPTRQNEFFIVSPKLRDSDALDDIQKAFDEEKAILTSEIGNSLRDHETETKAMIEKATVSHIDPIKRAMDTLHKKLQDMKVKLAGGKEAAAKVKNESADKAIDKEVEIHRQELQKGLETWKKKRMEEIKEIEAKGNQKTIKEEKEAYDQQLKQRQANMEEEIEIFRYNEEEKDHETEEEDDDDISEDF